VHPLRLLSTRILWWQSSVCGFDFQASRIPPRRVRHLDVGSLQRPYHYRPNSTTSICCRSNFVLQQTVHRRKLRYRKDDRAMRL